jgi:glycosyltransferase involved in cell wall biosynthesis
MFVTWGPPLPADRGARVRDLALISRVAAARPTGLLALLGSAGQEYGLAPLSDSLQSVRTAVVAERLRLPPRLGEGGPRTPLACAPFLDDAAVEAFATAVERERPALVQLEHWFLAPLLEVLAGPGRPAAVLSLHNVASAQYRAQARSSPPWRAAGDRLKLRLALGVERRVLPRFDAVVCVSERERELAAATAPGSSVEVVPNGVDCRRLRPLPDRGGAKAVLFVANLEYRPNLEAAEWLCRGVLPALARARPEATVKLVGPGGGRRLASLGRIPGVELTGPVDDLASHYGDAGVAVAPLLAGGGTRLKVLEAMALGRPVVSTSIGCEGLGVTPGEHLLVADDPERFAEAIARLLGSAAERASLASAGRALVEREYDWGRCASALIDVHDGALAARGRQGRNRRAAIA